MLYLPPLLQSKKFLKLNNKSVQGKITMHFVLTSISCTDATRAYDRALIALVKVLSSSLPAHQQ